MYVDLPCWMTQDHCSKIFANLCNIRHHQARIQREDDKRRRLSTDSFDKDNKATKSSLCTRKLNLTCTYWTTENVTSYHLHTGCHNYAAFKVISILIDYLKFKNTSVKRVANIFRLENFHFHFASYLLKCLIAASVFLTSVKWVFLFIYDNEDLFNTLAPSCCHCREESSNF